MISWISEAEVDWAPIDELQGLDPVFRSAVVVEPFPDASLKDVLADVHRELAVSYAESRQHRADGHAMWSVMESQIRTFIVMGADALAPRTVPDLLHLRDLDGIDRVLVVGRADSDVCEHFFAAGGRRGPGGALPASEQRRQPSRRSRNPSDAQLAGFGDLCLNLVDASRRRPGRRVPGHL